jgi:hypothetical protein
LSIATPPVHLCRAHLTPAVVWLYDILEPITGVPGEPEFFKGGIT